MEWILPLTVAVAFVLIACLAVSVMAFQKGVEALIEVKAMQKSTHQVQLVPAESLLGGPTDDELGNTAGRIEHDHYERIDDIIKDTDSMI